MSGRQQIHRSGGIELVLHLVLCGFGPPRRGSSTHPEDKRICKDYHIILAKRGWEQKENNHHCKVIHMHILVIWQSPPPVFLSSPLVQRKIKHQPKGSLIAQQDRWWDRTWAWRAWYPDAELQARSLPQTHGFS